MSSNIVNNTLSVLAGASLGAIATYLLDPDTGDRRLGKILSTAERTVSSTGERVSSHLRHATDAARGVAERISGYAGQAVEHLSHHADAVAGEVSKRYNNVASGARAAHDDMTNRAAGIYSDGRKSLIRRAGLHEPHPLTTTAEITATAVAFAAAGAGFMYYLDPERGRSRRNMATDKLSSWIRKSGKSARGYGRHLANKLKGTAHDVKGAVPESWSAAANGAVDAVSSVTAES